MKKLKNLLLVLLVSLMSLTSITSFSQTTHTIEYNNLDPIKFRDEYVLVGDSVVVINKTSYIGNIEYQLNEGTIVQSDGVDMNDTIYSFLVDESLEKLRVTIDGKSSLNVTFHKVGTVSTDNLNDLEFSLYPNPTSNVLNIDFVSNSLSMNGYLLEINNSLGQSIYSTKINTQYSIIDINSWINGIYFVHLTDNQGNIIDIRKIMLQQ